MQRATVVVREVVEAFEVKIELSPDSVMNINNTVALVVHEIGILDGDVSGILQSNGIVPIMVESTIRYADVHLRSRDANGVVVKIRVRNPKVVGRGKNDGLLISDEGAVSYASDAIFLSYKIWKVYRGGRRI